MRTIKFSDVTINTIALADGKLFRFRAIDGSYACVEILHPQASPDDSYSSVEIWNLSMETNGQVYVSIPEPHFLKAIGVPDKWLEDAGYLQMVEK